MRVGLPWGVQGHQPGDVVELPDEEAERLVRLGHAEPVGSAKTKSSSDKGNSKTVARDESTPKSEMDTSATTDTDEQEG